MAKYINKNVIDNMSKAMENSPIYRIERIINIILKDAQFDEFLKYSSTIRNNIKVLLENGFYPYNGIESFIDMDVKIDELIQYEISDIKEKINNIDIFFPIFNDYKDIIYEIKELYDSHKYRLCILSQINLVSQVYNYNFDYKDIKQCNEKVFKEKGIMTDDNKNFYEFMPFLLDEKKSQKICNKIYIPKKYNNSIEKNYHGDGEKYQNIPYNRNAIIHGYSKNFGTEENCLRWFSVMLNMLDICIKLDILNNGGDVNETKI